MMRTAVVARVTLTVAAIVAMQTAVCALAAAPVVLGWSWFAARAGGWGPVARVAAFSVAIIPSYTVFALLVMALSAASTRLTAVRTSPGLALRIADLDGRLMRWVCYMAAIHLVRVVAGTLFRGTPIWTAYVRLNGARIGRRVYINSTSISDHSLLEIGDDTVIGADVHMSGHTVEGGVLKTAEVRVGRNVTIGTNSILEIGVEVGDRCQVGALSFVPKRTRLAPDAVYAGVPAARIG